MSVGGVLTQGRSSLTTIGGLGVPSLAGLSTANQSTTLFMEESSDAALPENILELEFSDLGSCFRTTIGGPTESVGQEGFLVPSTGLSTAIAHYPLSPGRLDGVVVQLSLTGNNLSLQIRATHDTPHSEFVASTLHAALGLAGEGTVFVSVGSRRLRCTKFDLSLRTISQMLQSRQVAYRLMVIERAAVIGFQLPSRYSGSEIQTITFFYRAIVDRSFTWPLKTHPIRVRAIPEELDKLNKQPSMIRLIGDANHERLLGEPIKLGGLAVVIEQGIVEDFDKFNEELAVGDGHEVVGVVRSLTGTAVMETPEAPRLADNAWNPSEQALIALGPVLSARLADEYNRIAASTLDGLSEAEKAELTARPDFDEGLLFGGDDDGE